MQEMPPILWNMLPGTLCVLVLFLSVDITLLLLYYTFICRFLILALYTPCRSMGWWCLLSSVSLSSPKYYCIVQV